MKNNKNNVNLKSKTCGFSMTDVDYFHSDENESGIIKVYIIKKLVTFSILILTAALLIFITVYLNFRF